MSEQKPFRYHDEARAFGESLAEIKVAEPKKSPPATGALERIAAGKTAFEGMQASRDAAAAAAPDELQTHELKRKLTTLLQQKRKHAATAHAGVDAFIADAEKLANPYAPDVPLSAMTSGNGATTIENDRPAVARREGIHQGPAANLIAAGLKAAKQQKTAASRLDKEVARGTVGYHQVDPSIPTSLGRSGFGKGLSRISANAPAEAAPAAVDRRRALNSALFRNQHATGTALKNEMLPGLGPATLAIPGQIPVVYAPDTAGQFMRSASGGSFGKFRAGAGTVKPELLPVRKPVDATLNHAVMQHELGERSLATGNAFHLNASHFGVEPIVRENLALVGDPEAQRAMGKLRQGHSDDKLVQRLSRQVGAHPNSPIPLGGKQHKALTGALERNAGKLHKGTKQMTIQRAVQAAMVDPAHVEQFKTLPQALRGEVANFAGHTKKLLTKSEGGLLQKAKTLAQRASPMVSSMLRMKKIKW